MSFLNVANAETNLTKDISEPLVERAENGVIEPVSESEKLSSNQLDTILREIGYPDHVINMWDTSTKRELASNGGSVIDTQISDVKHTYVSTDGTQYEVTSETEDEVSEIQRQDLKIKGIQEEQISNYPLANQVNGTNDPSITTQSKSGSISDGKWEGLTFAVKLTEENSSEYRYSIVQQTYWSSPPNALQGDLTGIDWSSYGYPIANTATAGQQAFYDGREHAKDYSLDLSNNHGITAEVSLFPLVQNQGGYLSQQISVNKSFAGQTLTISNKYLHPWLPNNLSLGVSAAGFSISGVLEVGDVWSWQANFVAGE